jgi:hypothetical protein
MGMIGTLARQISFKMKAVRRMGEMAIGIHWSWDEDMP